MSVIFLKTSDFDIDVDIMYINNQTRLLISLLPFALWSEANRRANKQFSDKMNEFRVWKSTFKTSRLNVDKKIRELENINYFKQFENWDLKS